MDREIQLQLNQKTKLSGVSLSFLVEQAHPVV
jgi:hypothetical protein